MNKKCIIFLGVAVVIVLLTTGCTQKESLPVSQQTPDNPVLPLADIPEEIINTPLTAHFAEMLNVFQFQAKIPSPFNIEYIPEIESINIYDPTVEAATAREQSQIFIRYFRASRFLTLSTVTIFEQEKTTSNNHAATRYDIEKKPGVANFPYQPSWRNERHDLIDIRLATTSPTYFYVIARNPDYPKEKFEEFVNNIVYYTDTASYTDPLVDTDKREITKPFGIHITSETSPIQPEKFSGYHTGTDYEILSGEADSNVPVFAICGGPLKTKKIAQGYGGLVTQNCLLDDKDITVLYGHLSLDSVLKEAGEFLIPGEEIGFLGAGGTEETDGERKHLHLGITNTSKENIRGYVESKEELNQWIDPELLYL